MDEEEKLKLLYEKSSDLHKYFLDWRYKLIAGYLVIISAIGYFIFTWADKPENYDTTTYIITCSCGIIITIIFCLINHRITRLIWKSQNKAYLIEKDLGFKQNGDFKNTKIGLYGRLIQENVRQELDHGGEDYLERHDPKVLLKLSNHSGILNWLFIVAILGYAILLLQTCKLNKRASEWKKQTESHCRC